MKPIKDCIIIYDPVIASIYSGCDVWLIPWDESWMDTPDEQVIMPMCLEKAYVGDDWTIYNGCMFGYKHEQCYIAVEPDDKLGRI